MVCNQCPRLCNIDRAKCVGRCNARETLRIARVGLHEWEEPPISGTKGSGTIFFSGCNMGCSYCQNYSISQLGQGKNYTENQFIDAMKQLEDMGAHNINLVTANHYMMQILSALNKYKPSIPICYNTSSYDSLQSLKLMDDYVDIYLADLKYMDSNLAKQLSNAADYPSVATSAIKFMRNKKDVIVDGIMKKGLIIRHLVLPNCLDNTMACLDFIVANMPNSTYVSLMNQYTPMPNSPQLINRKLKPIEYKIAVSKLEKSNFNNVFIQESCSASESFIPQFYDDSIIK